MERQVRQVGGEAGETRRVDLLDQQLVERTGEILGEAKRLGGVGPPDAAGPAGRAASAARSGSIAGGMASSSSSGSSAPPIRSSSSGSPTGTSRGSSRPPPERRTKASWIARAARLFGTSRMPRARPVRLASMAGDQPRRERIGKGAVRRDGEDGRMHRPRVENRNEKSSASAFPQDLLGLARCSPAGRCRTTGPGGRRRSSARRRSPGPRGCWSKRDRRAVRPRTAASRPSGCR